MDRIEALRLFARLAEVESFTAAAQAQGIKQSTASKWIAALEAELGVALVARTTRAVQLTEAGRLLRDRTQAIVAAYDAVRAELGDRGPTPRGHLRLSVPVVFGRLFVLPALATFLARHPQVSVQLVMSDRYVRLVEEGFDLASFLERTEEQVELRHQQGD